MNRRTLLKCAGIGTTGLLAPAHTSNASTSAYQGKLNAVWVHGTAFEAENPGALRGIVRVGWGTIFQGKAGEETWFHVAIPTPVIVDGVHPTLDRVFAFYKTKSSHITNVHIYDGPAKIRSFDGLSLEGNLSGRVVNNPRTASNTWELVKRTPLNFGLGISIGVEFYDGTVNPEILFTSAGADFSK